MALPEFVGNIPGLSEWKHPEKIKFFGWCLHSFLDQERFSQSDIESCYNELHIQRPARFSACLKSLEDRKPKQLLKDRQGYYIPRSIRDELSAKHGQRKTTIELDKLLSDLPSQIKDLNERVFLEEALLCFRAGAFRAAIVMTWNLTYDHLCQWILLNHLSAFNDQLIKSFPKSRTQSITKKDDFEGLKESEVLQVCRSANLTTSSVHKILSDKLGKRNSAAHPSSIIINRLTTEEFISDLINNVVLKLI